MCCAVAGATRPIGVNPMPDNRGLMVVASKSHRDAATDAYIDRYGVRGVAQIQSLTPGLYTGESSGAMGGTISPTDTPGGGLTVEIDLAAPQEAHA